VPEQKFTAFELAPGQANVCCTSKKDNVLKRTHLCSHVV